MKPTAKQIEVLRDIAAEPARLTDGRYHTRDGRGKALSGPAISEMVRGGWVRIEIQDMGRIRLLITPAGLEAIENWRYDA